MKKLFFLFLALMATTCLLAEDFSVNGIYYNYLDGNNVEVTYRGNYFDSYDDEYSGAVTIPASVTYNGTTYSVTSIGDVAFKFCSSLTSVTIPNNVTSIGDEAFYDCYRLTSITIPNRVTSIGYWAFACCSSLISIIVEKGNSIYDSRENCNAIIETATNTLIAGCQNTTIPNSVISIGSLAFSYCSALTSVTIPNSVTSIGHGAFELCFSLTSVTIPNSVTNIEGCAFQNCSSLTSITIPNSVTSIGDQAFDGCSSLTSITIPNSVTSIGDYAFGDCSSLASVTIGNSVTSIEVSAFRGCSSLTSVTIGNSVTSIGALAFGYCSSLTSITIPNSVTSIGEGAFRSCSSLTSITIPNSVTSIGDGAFAWCSSLSSITCEAENPPTVYVYTFYNVSTSIPVYVPCGCVEAYKAASNWKDFTNIQGPLAEYSIQLSTSNSQMGTALVDYNTSCGNQISATANYGYHFVRWSDGNTDNPRSLGLTQDTVLTAEFAPNKYTITTVSSDTQRGTTKGDTTVNYLEYITISATANYGYHFTQWNDGNTENPRLVQVTEDTTYTAAFEKNTYSVSLSCNNELGSVKGTTSAQYLDTATISASPNFGYHFVQWSDGNTDNPRTLVLTQDITLTAEFAQSFSGQCGDNLYWELIDTTLHITGSGEMYNYKPDTAPWKLLVNSIKVLTIAEDVTKIGYDAFDGRSALESVVWNAKNYTNPANAEAAPFYGITSQIKSFTFGEAVEHIPAYLCDGMDKLTSVTIPNSVKTIGTSAFEGCVRLGKLSLGAAIENIAATAFAGCNRLYHIYCYPTYPPFADQSSFANYNVYLHVPCDYKEGYDLDIVWGKFKFIECIESEDATTDGNVTVDPGYNDVTITWPTNEKADSYSLVINKAGEPFCTLTFNAKGQLLNIAFAPGRGGSHAAPYALQTVSGYRFTVTGLTEATKYAYDITTKDAAKKTIAAYSGEFTTKSNVTTDMDNIQSPASTCQKMIRNGQLIILRDGKTYTTMGAEIQ